MQTHLHLNTNVGCLNSKCLKYIHTDIYVHVVPGKLKLPTNKQKHTYICTHSSYGARRPHFNIFQPWFCFGCKQQMLQLKVDA